MTLCAAVCSSVHVSMIRNDQAQVWTRRREVWQLGDTLGPEAPLPGWADPSPAHGAQTRLHSTWLLLFPPRSPHETINKCSSVKGMKSVFILLTISCQANRPVSRLHPQTAFRTATKPTHNNDRQSWNGSMCDIVKKVIFREVCSDWSQLKLMSPANGC